MRSDSAPPARLFGVLARDAPIGVLLRRGPSRWVQCILWQTDTDNFVMGQWFHGRVYERRCSLSSNGQLFVYFASKFTLRTVQDTEAISAWTAVSRPPYLTALALWPKNDCWNGGGLFQDNHILLLNHDQETHSGHTMMQQEQRIQQYAEHLHVVAGTAIPWFGKGEDYPLYPAILMSQSWQCVQTGRVQSGKKLDTWQIPEIWRKAHPARRFVLMLTRNSYRIREYALYDIQTAKTSPFAAEWADWDQRQRLVFARNGQVFAQSLDAAVSDAMPLADFNDNHPEPMPAPEWATEWPD